MSRGRRALVVVATVAAAALLLLVLVLLGLVVWSYRPGTLETFAISQTSAYAMLDDRCYINANVVTDAGLGIVRHPTSSVPGVCVVRGDGLSTGGTCDPALNVQAYVKSFQMEDVQGRQECVLRMNDGLSDSDAQTYAGMLLDDTVKDSTEYATLSNALSTCQGTVVSLNGALSNANALVQTWQGNYNDEVNLYNLCSASLTIADTSNSTLQQQVTADKNNYDALNNQLTVAQNKLTAATATVGTLQQQIQQWPGNCSSYCQTQYPCPTGPPVGPPGITLFGAGGKQWGPYPVSAGDIFSAFGSVTYNGGTASFNDSVTSFSLNPGTKVTFYQDYNYYSDSGPPSEYTCPSGNTTTCDMAAIPGFSSMRLRTV